MSKKLAKKTNELKKLAHTIREDTHKINLKMSKYNVRRVDLRKLFFHSQESYTNFKNKAHILFYIVIAITSIYFIIGLILASKGMIILGLGICAFGSFLILAFYTFMQSYFKYLDKIRIKLSEKVDKYIDSSLEIDKKKS